MVIWLTNTKVNTLNNRSNHQFQGSKRKKVIHMFPDYFGDVISFFNLALCDQGQTGNKLSGELEGFKETTKHSFC